jgi:hypothetical protein
MPTRLRSSVTIFYPYILSLVVLSQIDHDELKHLELTRLSVDDSTKRLENMVAVRVMISQQCKHGYLIADG